MILFDTLKEPGENIEARNNDSLTDGEARGCESNGLQHGLEHDGNMIFEALDGIVIQLGQQTHFVTGERTQVNVSVVGQREINGSPEAGVQPLTRCQVRADQVCNGHTGQISILHHAVLDVVLYQLRYDF